MLSNPEAEAAVLGYYLTADPDRQREVTALDLSLFWKHHAVLRAMQSVIAAGDPLDLVTLTDALRRTDPAAAGSVEPVAIMEAAAVTPGPHLRMLRDCARRRQLDALARSWLDRAHDPTADLSGLAEEARTMLDAPARARERFR